MPAVQSGADCSACGAETRGAEDYIPSPCDWLAFWIRLVCVSMAKGWFYYGLGLGKFSRGMLPPLYTTETIGHQTRLILVQQAAKIL